MNCEDIGTLRAYLDDELAARDGQRVRRHLEDCDRCRARLEEAQRTASLVQGAFDSLESPLALDQASQARALARIHAGLDTYGLPAKPRKTDSINPVSGRFSMIKKRFSLRPYRIALAGLAAVLVLALIGLTPQGQVAAANFLGIFQAQRLQPVTVDPREFGQAVTELVHFGDVDTSHANRNLSPAASVAEAAQQVGLSLKQPKNLPSGVPADPSAISVSTPSTVTFTFRVAKARSYLSSIGQSSFSIPAKFDGATLTVHVPAVVIMSYGPKRMQAPVNGPGSQNNALTGPAGEPLRMHTAVKGPEGPGGPDNAPTGIAGGPTTMASNINPSDLASLTVIEAGVPSADINGNVSASELRDLILRLPGLSANTVAQLKAISDWTHTVPVPLPANKSVWHEIDLGGGVQALAVGDNTGVGGFVVWQENGMFYGVGGPFKEDQLLAVARSLK